MAAVCATHHLFDAHAHLHGEQAAVPTYARGSKRLDYCVISEQMEPHIEGCGINLFNECIYSDHRALFIDINLSAFFGHGTPRLATPDQRLRAST
jgi:hypothetical protein